MFFWNCRADFGASISWKEKLRTLDNEIRILTMTLNRKMFHESDVKVGLMVGRKGRGGKWGGRKKWLFREKNTDFDYTLCREPEEYMQKLVTPSFLHRWRSRISNLQFTVSHSEEKWRRQKVESSGALMWSSTVEINLSDDQNRGTLSWFVCIPKSLPRMIGEFVVCSWNSWWIGVVILRVFGFGGEFFCVIYQLPFGIWPIPVQYERRIIRK